MNKRKNRIVVCMCLFIFMLSISSFFTQNNQKSTINDDNLSTSTDNYLFNGKEYDIELNDVYDDADPYKIYTGANFSYVFMENESTTFNEVVSNVNNSEKQLGDPIEFTTPYGTTDDLDNMKAYDGSYTSFFSTALPSIHEETPVIWSDFAYTYGSNGGTSGSAPYLDDNDGSYAYMNSASYVVTSGDTLLGYIEPNGNLISNWNEGDTSSHYLSIDEYPDTNGDGLNLRETSETVHDRWNFGSLTLPANSWVSKLEIKFYTLKQTGSGMYIVITSNELSQTSISMTESYSWRTRTLTGLNLDQTELNALYLDVLPAYSGEYNHGYVDIETVYINVYYKTSNTYYRHYSVLTFDYAGGSLDYLDTLYYDYATTVAIDMDLDIWDWVAGSYNVELQSNSGTGYITGSYDLSANPNKVSGTNQIRVRFETSGTTTTDFDVRIDQLMFDYVLTTDADPELEAIMETTFSNYNDPDILGIKINSYHRTDISQTITFSVYNYITPGWETITSQSQTSFTLNQFQSTSVSDYFDSGTMKIRYYGTSAVQDFDLFIDFINITITYKMDLSHSITFETNGLWKYRWILFGSIQYTDWTYFEVVDPVPNFHAISESDYATRWILQGSDISPVEDFHDDISGSNWDLSDFSERDFELEYFTLGDSEVITTLPDDNFGSNQYMKVYKYLTTEYRTFITLPEYDDVYFIDNSTGGNHTLKIYRYLESASCDIYVYETTTFSEGSITWNNQPVARTYIDTTTIIGNYAFKYIDIGNDFIDYIVLETEVDNSHAGFRSRNDVLQSQRPRVLYNIPKNYQGSGYMYMQTDETELISLKSQDYGTSKTLSSGDYFEVDFETSSDSQIDLILLNNSVVQKTLTLSQSGNTNFDRHTVQISVSESLEFDQLKISSTFEDQDNIKVYDIKTFKYTITGDYADFLVGSNRDYEVYLTPDIYNLRISEEGDEKINENITIPATGVLQYVYTPIERLECRIALFNIIDESLEFTDYHIKVNRSLNDVYNEFWLLDSIFSADKETYVYISIYDRFDTLIDIFERLTSDYIDLELEVYQLQIKNLMEQKTTLDINSSYTYPLLSGDSIYFILSKAYYQIGYYNPNNIYTQFLIYLDYNQAYELNMSRDCHIYYTNQRMEPLNFYQFKTYINGTRIITNMFYAMDGEHKGIEVKDLSDISVLNYTYIEGTGENNMFSLILTQYSLKVMSLQLCFNHINITRDPDHYGSNSYYWSEWLAPRETAEYFLFPGYYKINITNNEDGTSTYYSYTLNGDDYILIGSNNTIYNVLVNLANINTTIGNQITNVYIDLTNQNSNINNTIINIEINLDNVNSTLGSLLIDINTAISNIETTIISEIVSLGTEINNINSSITNEILNIGVDISNLDSSIQSQFVTLGVDISNINGSIINQIVSLGVDITNINTSLSNQILSVSVDISNLDTSITDQIVLMVADIENVNSTIYNQTLVMLADISNVNTTLLNQIIALGVDITNINATIINQILSLSVDLTNINSSISNLLIDLDLSITNLQNDIESFYVFTNNSFINLNNVMNTSFIYMENNIISINQSISNLVIGICNDIYFINGTISTMITQMGNNLLLMNVSINTALFDLGTTLDLIDCNITSNFILLNNSINLTNLNVNDSRIAIINNLLLINNTMSTLIANVYSAVYLVNNSIYTAVVDLGAYLYIMNNTISGNLSIVLQMNEFLTEIYQMTMFSELLNWTDIGLNTSLLTSQIDAWEFINHYKNQSVTILLRYNDLIDNLTVSAQNTIDQYLPNTGVEYREWSNELQDYIGEWQPLPENRTVNLGFFETDVPLVPRPLEADFYLFIAFIIIISVISIILVISWANMRKERDEVPEDTRLRHKRKKRDNLDWRKNYFDQT